MTTLVQSPTLSEGSGTSGYPPASPISEGDFKPVHSNYVPVQQEKHFQLIDFNSKGDVVLGCSSLNTRFWTGSLWYYRSDKEPNQVTDPEQCLTGVDVETGVFDARFLRDDQMVVGLDSGGVTMVTLTREEDDDRVTHHLEHHQATVEHDDTLTGLDIWTSDATVATCGLDKKVIVYNAALAPVHVYHPAHAGHVSDISCCQSSPHVFATCSRDVDTSVRIWDTRQSKPAKTIGSWPEFPPNHLTWVGEDKLLVGSLNGHVSLLDIKSGQNVTSVSVGNRPVYRQRLSPCGTKLAVAMDDAVVSVLKISDDSLEILMSQTQHGDFVRGLAWKNSNTLWSAGWDHAVIQYSL